MSKNRFKQLLSRTWFLASITIALLCAQQAIAQTKHETKAIQGLLWEVKISNQEPALYLYGSIHLGTEEFFPLAAPIEQAFAQAKSLVVEADITNEESNQAIIPILSYQAPDNLEKHLKPETWAAFTSLINVGLEETKKLRPALLATALTVGAAGQAGFLPQYGIDTHFLEQAKKEGKKSIIELEGSIFQGKLLASLSDEEGDALLSQTIAELKTGQVIQEFVDLANAWRNGDEKALATIFEETANKDPGSKKMLKLLVDDRNISMADAIEKLVKQRQQAFVVIGAGHLVGQHSVVELLRKKGLQLKRIQTSETNH